MDKGIVYLGCTAVLIILGLIGVKGLSQQVTQSCVGRTVYVKVAVTPTPEPTATPSAAIKSNVRISTPAAATNKTTVTPVVK